MTSSESESDDEDDEEDEEETDELDPNETGNASDTSSGARNNDPRSLRRSTRLARGGGGGEDDGSLPASGKSASQSRSSFEKGKRKRGSGAAAREHVVSFLDMNFWQKYPFFLRTIDTNCCCLGCREKICCGIIFKGQNNEMLIIPELFSPCSCRQRRTPKSSNSQMASSMPKLTKPIEPLVVVGATGRISDQCKQRKVLSHQDSCLSATSDCSVSSIETRQLATGDELDDRSSGISSLAACDESSNLLTPDSDLAMSDHLSTVSSSMIDVDDGSSNASSVTYDSLNHHEIELVKNANESISKLTNYSPQAVV